MNLVIVESPSKCSKIQGFLGPGWKVLASMGHIRHLIEDIKALHIEDGFKPEYEFMKDKYKTINQLKVAANEATKIYLASDDDREGEAISYSVAIALKLNTVTNPRIVFHEITKTAVLHAIQNPRTINMNRVNSQQARAVLDLMVGFTISPLLWRFVGSALSAGRCQTPALRLIVEKDNDINNFKKEATWEVKGSWCHNATTFSGRMIESLESEEDAENYLENVHNLEVATVTHCITKPTTHSPPLPLITSSLQQEASAMYNSNPKNTMRIAQKLYEEGHITYMRTDSVAMSEEAISDARKTVEKTYGKEYLSNGFVKKAKNNTDSLGAHDKAISKGNSLSNAHVEHAHEAIRPTHFNLLTLDTKFNQQEKNIYNLIYKRALQSVMAIAKGEEKKIQWIIDNDPSEFIHESIWKRTTFQGWKIVGMSESDLDEKEQEEEQSWKTSESLTENLKIKWKSLQAEERVTNPPSRYTEATLVRELEKKGIGRPSTFASLVASIVDKNYVETKNEEAKDVQVHKLILSAPNTWPPKKQQETKKVAGQKQKMFPTILGKQVYEFCIKEFKELFDYGFTKQMEDRLDLVESGSEEWRKLCSDTYNSYKDKYEQLKKVPAKEISNSKKIVLANGYEAVVGKFGPVLIKDKAFLGWPEGIAFKDITDALIEKFIIDKEKPDIFGYHEGEMLVRKKGKFGEYIVYNGTNITLKPGDSVETIIERSKSKSETLHTLGEYVFKNGPYGIYMMKKVTPKGKKPVFVSIPSGLDVKTLSEEAAKKIYETNMNKPKQPFKKKE